MVMASMKPGTSSPSRVIVSACHGDDLAADGEGFLLR